MFKWEVDFVDKDKFDNFSRYLSSEQPIYGMLEVATQILAHHIADNMIETICSLRKRPDRGTHKLENNILAIPLNTTGGIEYGIGEISVLDKEAPYWRMLNDGATYTTKQDSKAIPLTYFDGTNGFIRYKAGDTHTIFGIDFVGKAIANLDKEMRDVIEKLGGDILDGLERA
jgi:hypothetical protein